MKQSKSGLLKLTILSISLMISAASAIAVTLPMIKNQFPDIQSATVESLVTIPSFTMMVFILLSTFIIKAIGKKNTVLLGLLLAFVGGIIPVFVSNFTIISFSFCIRCWNRDLQLSCYWAYWRLFFGGRTTKNVGLPNSIFNLRFQFCHLFSRNLGQYFMALCL